MLFDLEDYRTSGIVGVARKSIGNVYWLDSYTTWRATHDAYRRAVNEWCLASNVMASLEDRHQLMLNYIDINDKFTDSFRKGKIFFNALCSKSIPAEIVAANGITEGTALRIFVVYNGESWYNDFIDLPNLEYPWGTGNKYVLYVGEDSPNGYSELIGRSDIFVYTTMTQTIYDAHKNAIVDLQTKIKETYILAEGISDIPEWIAPAIPVWEESAELSGYVRDSRSLPISGATVRLVDADGVNHDLVTNDLGYYHFTKEYIYNNISLGTASSAEFNMFVLEETISGTVLYDQTSIFQNSFFGALNDRGLNWPVLVKAGKQNRRNFKIEFIPDYSAYPSFSGHVIDENGNPVQNVLMEIYHRGLDKKLTETSSTSNTIINSTKFSLFGENKSLLTDENGYYEYPSQYVGEWFNKWKVAQGYEREFNLDAYNVMKGFSYDSDFMKHNGVYSGISNGNYYAGSSLLGNLGEAYFTMPYYDKSVLYEGNWIYQNSMIIKFDQYGVLDTSYMENIQISDIPVLQAETSTSTMVKLLKQSDGKIIVYGRFMDTVHGYKCLMRLNIDGTVDTTFDGSFFESVFTDYSTWKSENNWIWNTVQPNCGVVQDDDKIVLAGLILSGNQFGVLRFNADGTLDDTFVGGLTKTGESLPESIELQSDGKILLGGLSELTYKDRTSSEDPYMIIRLNTDGTLDDTFNLGLDPSGSKRIGNIYSHGYTILSMKYVSDGILIGGNMEGFWADNGFLTIPHFLKLTTSGEIVQLDMGGDIGQTTYGNDGHGYSFVVDIEVIEDRVLISDNSGTYILKLSDGSMDFEKVSAGRLINGQGSQISVEGNSILVRGYISQLNDSISNNWQGNGFVKFNYENISVIKNGLEVGVLDGEEYDFSLNSTQLNLDPYGYYHVTADDVEVFVNPFIQNKESGEIISVDSDPTMNEKFYDLNDYFNSRFEFGYFYQENRKKYKFIKHIEQSNVINVNEIKVDPEVGAEKIYFTPHIDPLGNNGDSSIYNIGLLTTTGYLRAEFHDGTHQIYGNGSQNFINIWKSFEGDEGDVYTDRTFYVYSCNVFGGAEGYAKEFYCGKEDCEFDIDNATKLERININSRLNSEINLYTFASTLLYLQINNRRKTKLNGLSDCLNLLEINLNGSVYTNVEDVPNESTYSLDWDDVTCYDNISSIINGSIRRICEVENGNILVGGYLYGVNDFNLRGFPNEIYPLGGIYTIVKLDSNLKRIDSFNIPLDLNGEINDLGILSDGRYIVTGSFGIKIYDANGQLSQYDTNLPNTYNILNGSNVKSFFEQEDGKIIVCGSFNYDNRNNIIRFKTDGSMDNTFTSIPSEIANSEVSKIVKIPGSTDMLIYSKAGSIISGGVTKALLKIDVNGIIDSEFTSTIYESSTVDSEGNTINIGFAGGIDSITKIEFLTDDSIVIAGGFIYYKGVIDPVYGESISGIVILNSDFSFNYNLFNQFLSLSGTISDLLIDDDKIYMVGNSFSYSTKTKYYDVNGLLCIRLDGSIVETQIGYINGSVNQLLLTDTHLLLSGDLSGWSLGEDMQQDIYSGGIFRLKKEVKKNYSLIFPSISMEFVGINYNFLVETLVVPSNTNLEINRSSVKSITDSKRPNQNSGYVNLERNPRLTVFNPDYTKTTTININRCDSFNVTSMNLPLFTNLQSLTVNSWDNTTTGIVDLSGLSTLTNLTFTGYRTITGLVLPNSLYELKIRSLSLLSNFSIPSNMTSLQILELRDMYSTDLSGVLSSISNLTSLTVLIIRNCYNLGTSNLDLSFMNSNSQIRISDLNLNSFTLTNKSINILELSWINTPSNFSLNLSGSTFQQLEINSLRQINSLNFSNVTVNSRFKVYGCEQLTSIVYPNISQISDLSIEYNPKLKYEGNEIPWNNRLQYIYWRNNGYQMTNPNGGSYTLNLNNIWDAFAPIARSGWGMLVTGGNTIYSMPSSSRSQLQSKGWYIAIW